MMTEMQKTIRKNMLRYHVSQTMFCPTCSTCLDVKRAVSVDVNDSNGDLKLTKCLCGNCFDKIRAKLIEACAAKGLTLDVTDGRPGILRKGRG